METHPSAPSKGPSARAAKSRGAGAAKAVVVRAEVRSPAVFVLTAEVPEGIPAAGLEAMWEDVSRSAPELAPVVRQLADARVCEADAADYQSVKLALEACVHAARGKLQFVALPPWVADALPAFGGCDHGQEVPGSFWLPNGLMPYQRNAVRRALAQCGRVLLADEMGLGKTAQALAAVAQYLEGEGPALVVVPSSLGAVWRDEARRWLPDVKPTDIQLIMGTSDRPLPQKRMVIVSYNLFSRAAKALSRTAGGDPWQIVVCDEAHYLRNPTSQRSRTILPLLQAAKRVVLVTGTPTPKQASEAYTLVHALKPLGCTFKEWCDRYGAGRTESREAEVAALLAEVMVRRVKADVLDQLPEKRRQRVALPLPAASVALLRRLEKQGASDDEHFQQLARIKEAVAQDYTEYLLEASTTKFLLFAHHISMLDALERTVTKHGTGCMRIDGSTPVAERAGLVARFQTDPHCRVAVLSILAAGEGLTLTAASLCVFCELCPAVPGVIEQAEARVHRIGQKAARVDVHYLVVEGTRDGAVFDRLESRAGAVARATSGVEALPAVRAEVRDAAAAPPEPARVVSGAPDLPVAAAPPVEAAARAPAGRLRRACADEAGGQDAGAMSAPVRRRPRRQGLDSLLASEIGRAQAELTKAPAEEGGEEKAVAPGPRQAAGAQRRPRAAQAAAPAGAKRRRGEPAAAAATAAPGAAAAAAPKEEEDPEDMMLRFFAASV